MKITDLHNDRNVKFANNPITVAGIRLGNVRFPITLRNAALSYRQLPPKVFSFFVSKCRDLGINSFSSMSFVIANKGNEGVCRDKLFRDKKNLLQIRVFNYQNGKLFECASIFSNRIRIT